MKTRRFLLYSAYLVLVLLAPVYTISSVAGGSLWLGLAALALASFGGYALSAFVVERRLLFTLFSAAALAALTIVFVPYSRWNIAFVPLVVATLLVGARNAYDDPDTEIISVKLMAAGLLLCGICWIGVALAARPELEKPISMMGYVLLVVSILLINRKSVKQNAGTQAGRMMRSNQVLTVLFLAVLSVFVFWSQLAGGVGWLLKRAVGAFLSLFQGGGDSASSAMESAGDGGMDLSQLGDDNVAWPAWLQTLTNVILYVVAAVALLALLIFIVWSIYKGVKALMKWWREWSSRFDSEGNEDYAEESEQLLSAESMRKQMAQQIAQRVKKLFARPVRWSGLSAREKVRQVYARLLAAQAEISPQAENWTPQELTAQAEKDGAFARLYDRARYSEEPITETEAEAYRAYGKE